MITYDEIITKKLPFDASGIDIPQNYLWVKREFENYTNMYYPKMRIVTDVKVNGYEDGLFILEVNCISAVNHDTEVADYSYFYCEWDSNKMHSDAIEWQWRCKDCDECPPYYEAVEGYIENAYIKDEITVPKSRAEFHLQNMVELVAELQGTELTRIEEDMPQEYYDNFLSAQKYIKNVSQTLKTN